VPPPLATPPPPAEPELPPLLDHFPVPRYVWVLAIVTVVAFLFGLARTPHAIEIAIKDEQGQRALNAGDADKAVKLLKQVNVEYPAAKDVTIDLADANEMAGNLKDAAIEVQSFEGKEVSKEQEDRLNSLQNRLESDLKELE